MTTSSYCVGGDCLVVEYTGTSVIVQDTKLLGVDGGPVQVWLPVEWNDLLRSARRYTTSTQYVRWDPTAEEFPFTFGLSRHDEIELTGQEWLDFVCGVRGGQFEIHKLSSPALVGPTSGRSAATGAVESSPTPAPVAAGGGRNCATCGKPTILGRYVDGALLVMDAEPVTDGQAVLKGDHADVPVVLFGIDDEHDADFWGVPFESDRYDRHECAPTPDSAVAGPNVVSMYVPAGRDLRDESTPVGSLDAVATTGQPGLEPSQGEIDELAELIAEAYVNGMYAGRRTLARWLLGQGYRRNPDLLDAEAAWKRLAAPLVPLDTSDARRDVGWAPPPGVNEAGEVGPAHPRLGPTGPADCEQARA